MPCVRVPKGKGHELEIKVESAFLQAIVKCLRHISCLMWNRQTIANKDIMFAKDHRHIN